MLVALTIENKLRELNDQAYAGFVGFPADVAACALAWATAVDTYASAIIPASSSSAAAKTAFQTTMLGLAGANGLVILTAAFTAYATALATGMAPTFIATPPPIPIDISSIIPVGLAGADGHTIATLLATIIDTWFRTGTATPSGGGSPVLWS